MTEHVNGSLAIWRAYCDKKMELEDAEERIGRLQAILERIANLETKWFPSKQDLLLEMIREAREVLNESKP